MAVTIEEARQFISDARKYREDFINIANRSWDELKRKYATNHKRQIRRAVKYPAWFSITQIRKPLVLSRAGVPICKDTTQDGNDHVGATAAVLKERLAVNLRRSFDFLEVMMACRDDFLATNFAMPRAYYDRKEVKERVKEYITPEVTKDETGQETVIFRDSNGDVVETDDIFEDEQGKFVYANKVVDIEEERVFLEHVLYKHVYIDPNIKHWGRCRRLAYEHFYSPQEFKQMFGSQAYRDLPIDVKYGQDESVTKIQNISVFEYWDDYEQKCYWLTETSKEFLKPKGYLEPNDEDYYKEEASNGLYNLDGLFPSPKPLMVNSPTDGFWPIPEYLQIEDIFDNIHVIFAKMYRLAKGIKIKLLHDANIEQLGAALHESHDGDTFAVPNLTQALAGAGGKLSNVAQYLDIMPLITALEVATNQLDQNLTTIYRLTGTSDLLQAQTDNVARTYGEQQMKEKYALNLLAPMQQKMQEFVRDCDRLLTEMALRNFKDASLDRYILPNTLPEEHKPRYRAALGMLKEDPNRFELELETDSTIALNEEYDKQIRIELVNTMTSAIEKVASVAETNPALLTLSLHALKHLVQGFRQGKLFQAEITQAIDNVIKANEEAQQNAAPPFDKDQAMAELKKLEIDAKTQIEGLKINTTAQIEAQKLAQNERLAGLEAQVEGLKVRSADDRTQVEAQIKLQQIAAQFEIASQELAGKREALMVEVQKITDESQRDQMRLTIDAMIAQSEQALAQARQALDEQLGTVELQERLMTENRLQEEHQTDKMVKAIEMAKGVKEISTPDVMPQPQTPKRKQAVKLKKDKNGNLVSLEAKDERG